jgi:hypothetical protein
MQAWYTTREKVLASFEVAETTRIAPLIDTEIIAASESVDSQLHRHFTVETMTRAFDWPSNDYAPSWRLYLNDYTLIEKGSLVAGGTTIGANDYLLYRADGVQQPPYSYIEINRASSAAFSAGSTPQNALLVTGVWGHTANTDIGGTLSAAINDSETTLVINPASNRLRVGVGSTLVIGGERMQVTDRGYNDSGTVLLTDKLESRQGESVIEVIDTSKLSLYDRIGIDGEFMDVLSIMGAYVTVRRATNGSVLASHDGGVPIYVPNTYTVTRAGFGTTAEGHAQGSTVHVQRYPALVEQLTLAEAVVGVAQNAGGYARVVGSGSSTREAVGKGLDDMRAKAYAALGRKLRKSAI